MQIIRDLKQFDAETTPLEDMVILAAIAKATRSEFEQRNIPTPEWLDDVNRRLTTAIDNQTREAKLLRLRELEAQEQTLMSREEKRSTVAAEKKRLLEELGAK